MCALSATSWPKRVFFARRGDMASNRREDHEVSMLALHLIQNCMVCVNTLMIQKCWLNRTGRDDSRRETTRH